MAPTIEVQGVAVVVLGSFNPPMYHPAFLAEVGVAPPLDDSGAALIITGDIAQFPVLHMTFSADRAKLEVQAPEPPWESIRDLAVSALELAGSAPIRAVGINKRRHYALGSDDAWHAAGHTLVPKDMWEPMLVQPGTRRLDVEGTRPDGRDGRILVTVEPSLRVQNGLYIQVNDHFALGTEDDPARPDDAVSIISEVFKDSLDRADDIMDRLLEAVT